MQPRAIALILHVFNADFILDTARFPKHHLKPLTHKKKMQSNQQSDLGIYLVAGHTQLWLELNPDSEINSDYA